MNFAPESAMSSAPASIIALDPLEAMVSPIAFTLSYLVPTLLFSVLTSKYTTFKSSSIIMAFWERYPIPFKISQYFITAYFPDSLLLSVEEQSEEEKKRQSLKNSYRRVHPPHYSHPFVHLGLLLFLV